MLLTCVNSLYLTLANARQVALVGSYELLMVIIRGAQVSADGRAGSAILRKIRCKSRLFRCSPMSLRPSGFPRFARSVLGSKSGSHSQRIRGYLAALNGM